MIYQVPQNCLICEEAGLPLFTYEELFAEVRNDLALDDDIYYATGVRAADSVMRGTAMRKYGPINHRSKRWAAIWDWNSYRLEAALRANDVKLPLDYRWWGRTFDGIDYKFMSVLRTEAPRDYQRILEIFPLVEADAYRWEKMAI